MYRPTEIDLKGMYVLPMHTVPLRVLFKVEVEDSAKLNNLENAQSLKYSWGISR